MPYTPFLRNTKLALHQAKPTSWSLAVTVTSHCPGRMPGDTMPTAVGTATPSGTRTPSVPAAITLRWNARSYQAGPVVGSSVMVAPSSGSAISARAIGWATTTPSSAPASASERKRLMRMLPPGSNGRREDSTRDRFVPSAPCLVGAHLGSVLEDGVGE